MKELIEGEVTSTELKENDYDYIYNIDEYLKILKRQLVIKKRISESQSHFKIKIETKSSEKLLTRGIYNIFKVIESDTEAFKDYYKYLLKIYDIMEPDKGADPVADGGEVAVADADGGEGAVADAEPGPTGPAADAPVKESIFSSHESKKIKLLEIVEPKTIKDIIKCILDYKHNVELESIFSINSKSDKIVDLLEKTGTDSIPNDLTEDLDNLYDLFKLVSKTEDEDEDEDEGEVDGDDGSKA